MRRPPSSTIRLLLSLGLLSALAAPASFAASPALNSISPRGVQRGTEAVFTFSGARLGDTEEILFYTPGFSVTSLEKVNDGQIKATIKVAPTCQLGEHAVRLRARSGISELRTLLVGALPPLAEKEPNNDFAAPQQVPLNVTIEGTVTAEDVDYYLVEAKKGQRLSAEVEGMRLGVTLFDPYVAILDTRRFELAAADDTAPTWQDPLVSIVVPEDGQYVIQVRESAYGGNGNCHYRLHVGTFPRPLAVYPAGGKVGEEVEIRFLGDPAGEIRQKVKLPGTLDGLDGLFAQDSGGVAPSANAFRLSEYGNVLEVEPNDSHAQATPAPSVPIAFNGILEKPGDVDHFRFTATRGTAFEVHCYARRIGSPLDPVMRIHNLNGGQIAANDDTRGPDSYFRFNVPADKEYVISVSDHLGKGGPDYVYRIEMTPVQPQTQVTIPKVANFSQERQTIAVPRGNRFATLMSVGRRDFGGDVSYKGEGLPGGVALHAETVPASLDAMPVVFEAAPDAALGGTLGRVIAVPADPAQKIDPRFYQSVELVTGGPGQSVYWKKEVERLAFAVTEEVPFKINIVEPRVPLVQRGSMSLRIVAERKPGFTAPITIRSLFNPPGISSATSATIPEGQNETVLQLNAAPNAPVKKWKTAVLATANVNGPVWVSSQLATIEVAPPLVTFEMERTAGEQGKEIELFCKIQQNTPFEGKAKVKLLGLPSKVTAPDREITRETTELAFKLTLDPSSPPGQHRNIFCQVVFEQNGEPIVMASGSTELRIDKPLPPRPDQPAPVAAKPQPKPEPGKPPEKRLSRLEQLRLEQEEREKAAREGKK